ncbi:MAG: flavocytochrome c [Furfurilactobacillus sp.]|jgi:fumarate reductase flavoprotein subunit|uniref:flavocytochrome c n=1 Tax=Furfurilactobacillus TaxID=2767882 RepID=UPI001EEED5EA|nr:MULTISPECIES: flavocytochrome c [Furfurilactobacillus]MCF6418493.1 flavocytochrome c [Furfurilactobacillus milii]MCH4011991.1 flavocytochrome c [Furfurilactobacillus sp.]MCH4037883.1 flavocytochrome c [Furfurilactobacillus sp.]MCH4115480.1 flavocytochrome c [Furfurilactobacillus sp.]MCI1341309.1 flavocytochrome c [Furfurilactobacillus sp.]
MAEKFRFQPSDINALQDSYDVVIIGSGSTGMVAAIQAHELGLKPVIFEKMPKIGGNTMRASSGMNAAETNVQLHHGVVDSYEDFYAETLKGGGDLNDKELLGYFSSHAALSIDWLADHGIRLDDITITGGMSKMRTHRPASMAPIGAFLVTELSKVVQKDELPLFTGVTVNSLVKDADGKVTGVNATLPDGSQKMVGGKAVVLATGGFGANNDMIEKYRPDLKGYKTTNQPGATGDGLKLATDVGAALVQMDQIQVHPTVQQDNPHAFLIGEAVRGEGAILVNAQGKRFVNELTTRKVVSNAITALPEHSAYLILDQGIRSRVKAIEFYDSIGLVVTGSSLSELAGKLNMDVDALSSTVSTWNTAVADHDDKEFGRSTGMDRDISAGPFFAIHIAPAIHYTMGGIKANHKTQVLDESGQIILGLFAGGEVVGGLHGNNRIGGNSIAETVIFGRQAGEQVYDYIKG